MASSANGCIEQPVACGCDHCEILPSRIGNKCVPNRPGHCPIGRFGGIPILTILHTSNERPKNVVPNFGTDSSSNSSIDPVTPGWRVSPTYRLENMRMKTHPSVGRHRRRWQTSATPLLFRIATAILSAPIAGCPATAGNHAGHEGAWKAWPWSWTTAVLSAADRHGAHR